MTGGALTALFKLLSECRASVNKGKWYPCLLQLALQKLLFP